jgi:hypothetical protein
MRQDAILPVLVTIAAKSNAEAWMARLWPAARKLQSSHSQTHCTEASTCLQSPTLMPVAHCNGATLTLGLDEKYTYMYQILVVSLWIVTGLIKRIKKLKQKTLSSC